MQVTLVRKIIVFWIRKITKRMSNMAVIITRNDKSTSVQEAQFHADDMNYDEQRDSTPVLLEIKKYSPLKNLDFHSFK